MSTVVMHYMIIFLFICLFGSKYAVGFAFSTMTEYRSIVQFPACFILKGGGIKLYVYMYN